MIQKTYVGIEAYTGVKKGNFQIYTKTIYTMTLK